MKNGQEMHANGHKWTENSDCHTLSDSTNGCVTDSKILCPFLSVCMRFMSISYVVNASRVRWYPFCPVLSLGKFRTCLKLWTDATEYVPWVNVTHALICGFSGSGVVCPALMCLAFYRYPVCIRWCPLDLNCEWSTVGQVKEFPRRVPHVHSLILQPTFCPFLIWYIFVLFVIHLLHIRLLTFLYPLLVRTYALLTTSATIFTTAETTSITG